MGKLWGMKVPPPNCSFNFKLGLVAAVLLSAQARRGNASLEASVLAQLPSQPSLWGISDPNATLGVQSMWCVDPG